MAITVTVDLNKLPQAMERNMRAVAPAAQLTAQKIAVQATAQVPRDTGSLARTIMAVPDPEIPYGWRVIAGNTQGGFSGDSRYDSGRHEGAPVDYAIAVHEGNRGRSADPFLLQPAMLNWEQFQQALAVALMSSWSE